MEQSKTLLNTAQLRQFTSSTIDVLHASGRQTALKFFPTLDSHQDNVCKSSQFSRGHKPSQLHLV